MHRILLQCQDRHVTIDVRRAADRFVTRAEGRTTWHSFSFGAHYDPGNVGFGSLVAHNEEHLPPGTGYADHRHHDVEIITLVLDGALRHTDSSGRSDVLVAGQVSRTSAGAGIVHSETSDTGVETRFVQAWLRPDEPGGPSSYAMAQVGRPTELTEVVGPEGALQVGTRGARLHLARPEAGALALPDARLLHLFVVDGTVILGDRQLRGGDAARLTGEGGRALGGDAQGTIAVWSFD